MTTENKHQYNIVRKNRVILTFFTIRKMNDQRVLLYIRVKDDNLIHSINLCAQDEIRKVYIFH